MAHNDADVKETVDRLITATGPQRTHILEVLHGVQKRYHHVPRAAADEIYRQMGVSVADTYGLVTFYDLFSVEPQGKHVLRICDDVICHLKGAADLVATAADRIGPEGRPTPGGELSWERCACLGLCERAPAATKDGVPVAPLAAAAIAAGEGHE